MNNAVSACLCFNRPDLAEQMVRQLPFIWIFDNGSSTPIDLPNVALRGDRNRYFSAGWNLFMGLIQAHPKIEYVWMLNDDVLEVDPYKRDAMIIFMENYPECAAATPAFNSPHAIFQRRNPSPSFRQVPWMDWCCPMVRVAAWKDVGMFDENLPGYGADIDWCWRARKKWQFWVVNSIEVKHLGSETSLSQGTQHIMGDVAGMDKYLTQKWNVKSFWDLTK